jgi:hypothetical protein
VEDMDEQIPDICVFLEEERNGLLLLYFLGQILLLPDELLGLVLAPQLRDVG